MAKAPTPEEMLKKLGLSTQSTLLDDVEEPEVKKPKEEQHLKSSLPEDKGYIKKPEEPSQAKFQKPKTAKGKKVVRNKSKISISPMPTGKTAKSIKRHERYELDKAKKELEKKAEQEIPEGFIPAPEIDFDTPEGFIPAPDIDFDTPSAVPIEDISKAYERRNEPTPLSYKGEDELIHNMDRVIEDILTSCISISKPSRLTNAVSIWEYWQDIRDKAPQLSEDDIEKIEQKGLAVKYASRDTADNATTEILQILQSISLGVPDSVQQSIEDLQEDYQLYLEELRDLYD